MSFSINNDLFHVVYFCVNSFQDKTYPCIRLERGEPQGPLRETLREHEELTSHQGLSAEDPDVYATLIRYSEYLVYV